MMEYDMMTAQAEVAYRQAKLRADFDRAGGRRRRHRVDAIRRPERATLPTGTPTENRTKVPARWSLQRLGHH
jgi:hypothetical protein